MLYDLWKDDPKAALKKVLSETYQGRRLLWVSRMGTDGVRYGKYSDVSYSMLRGTEYTIEFWDGNVSIHFTDTLFNPDNNRIIPKE